MPVDVSVAGEIPAYRGLLGLGHGISTTFHVMALYFGAAYLLITIPVHLIYTAVALAKQDRAPRVRIHVANVVPDVGP
jgi:hypothetical protein